MGIAWLMLFYLQGMLLAGSAATFGAEKPIWHPGEVELRNGTLLEGDISYSLEFENVQFREPGTRLIKTFSAADINMFSFHDRGKQSVRVFYSLPYTNSEGYTTEMFFELIFDGYFTLLSRETTIDEAIFQESERHLFYPVIGMPGLRYKDNYFVLNDDGFFKLAHNEKDLLALMPTMLATEVKKYIEKYRLNLKYRRDMVKVLNYFHTIVN